MKFFCLKFFIVGAMDTPVENHLYCVSYSSKDSPVRLTRECHHHHEVFLSLKCNIFLSIFSSIDVPTSAEVFRLKSNSGVAKFPLAYIINSNSGANYENHLLIIFSFLIQITKINGQHVKI